MSVPATAALPDDADRSARLSAVAEGPETRYSRSADGTHIAYQVHGSGSIDLVAMHGSAVPLDLLWDDSGFSRLGARLGAFSRTIWLEPRGVGASGGDPVDPARGHHFVEDLTAVLDDVGCARAVLLGASTFGQSAITFAATHPERVFALILVNTYAHYLRDAACPFGIPSEKFDGWLDAVERLWGTEATVPMLAPSQVNDERFRQRWCRGMRLAVTPRQISDIHRACFTRDVRPLLASLEVPTLILHREEDRYIRAESGRYLAGHIPHAKFVLLPGGDSLIFAGDTDGLADEIEEFLTGRHQEPEGDVMLMAVLFTDIVRSTEQATMLGPRTWRRLSDEHDALVRTALQRHRGREIKTIGDGFLATFDSGLRATRCAAEISRGATALGLAVRAGVHTGDVEVRSADVAGLAVTIAKRICDLAAPGEVLVSETIRELIVGSDTSLSLAGTHVLKGVPNEWRLWAVDA
jgi:class 3 adenylate cyclase